MMPRCWNNLQDWIEWNRFNQQVRSAPDKPLDHYCTDCSPEYRDRMVAENRCAYPDVTFSQLMQRVRDPNTGRMVVVLGPALRGYRNAQDEAAWQLRYQKRKEVDDGKN